MEKSTLVKIIVGSFVGGIVMLGVGFGISYALPKETIGVDKELKVNELYKVSDTGEVSIVTKNYLSKDEVEKQYFNRDTYAKDFVYFERSKFKNNNLFIISDNKLTEQPYPNLENLVDGDIVSVEEDNNKLKFTGKVNSLYIKKTIVDNDYIAKSTLEPNKVYDITVQEDGTKTFNYDSSNNYITKSSIEANSLYFFKDESKSGIDVSSLYPTPNELNIGDVYEVSNSPMEFNSLSKSNDKYVKLNTLQNGGLYKAIYTTTDDGTVITLSDNLFNDYVDKTSLVEDKLYIKRNNELEIIDDNTFIFNAKNILNSDYLIKTTVSGEEQTLISKSDFQVYDSITSKKPISSIRILDGESKLLYISGVRDVNGILSLITIRVNLSVSLEGGLLSLSGAEWRSKTISTIDGWDVNIDRSGESVVSDTITIDFDYKWLLRKVSINPIT